MTKQLSEIETPFVRTLIVSQVNFLSFQGIKALNIIKSFITTLSKHCYSVYWSSAALASKRHCVYWRSAALASKRHCVYWSSAALASKRHCCDPLVNRGSKKDNKIRVILLFTFVNLR